MRAFVSALHRHPAFALFAREVFGADGARFGIGRAKEIVQASFDAVELLLLRECDRTEEEQE